MKNRLFSLLIFLILLHLSCGRDIYHKVYPTLNDGKYDSEFPYRSSSQQLETIGETIRLINTLSYYQTYLFQDDTGLILSDLTAKTLKDHADTSIYTTRPASGTATLFYHDDFHIALLTCAHIVYAPDTLITYFPENSDIIQTVSIKERQVYYVREIPDQDPFEILAMDLATDIAILGKRIRSDSELLLPTFDYPLGKAKELEWGTFVYVVGYPLGYKMITKGIVSNPNRDGRGSFLIDAPFNRGFSGGVILAIRDGVPNFEWVGIARSVAADYENLLIPDPHYSNSKYDPNVPYDGDIYVKSSATIRYGITHVVSIELILDFLKDNRTHFEERGYYFPDRFYEG